MTNKSSKQRILVQGAGEMATACIRRLHLAGLKVLALELEKPICVRRMVCLAEAVYEQRFTVENVTAVLIDSISETETCWSNKELPIMIDPHTRLVSQFSPDIIIDARMKKRDIGSSMDLARLVIGLGPGFTVGENCHLIIETLRGHHLGRVIRDGSAQPDTGIPGEIGGESIKRVLRAPCQGTLKSLVQIGEMVSKDQPVAEINGQSVHTPISGMLRGMIRDGTAVTKGVKIGDVDPRGERSLCFTISDKANAIAGGVIEAIL